MKANEFVLEHGWDAAKRLVENNKHTGRTLSPSELELKRLVESHELVINWKLPEDDETGLDGAHLYLDYYATYSNYEEKAKLHRLKQAIADVES